MQISEASNFIASEAHITLTVQEIFSEFQRIRNTIKLMIKYLLLRAENLIS